MIMQDNMPEEQKEEKQVTLTFQKYVHDLSSYLQVMGNGVCKRVLLSILTV